MRTEYQKIYQMIIALQDLGASEEFIKDFFTTVASLQSQNERMKEALEVRGIR